MVMKAPARLRKKEPELFINRELSWLEFNGRVLEEAMDPATPLLDRLRFAIIVSTNLDEFFMVRVAALKHAVEEGDNEPDLAGLRPRQRLHVIAEVRDESAVPEAYHRLVAEIVKHVHEGRGHRPARVHLVRSGTIPKTSSGKIQRARLGQMIQEGALRDRLVYEP